MDLEELETFLNKLQDPPYYSDPWHSSTLSYVPPTSTLDILGSNPTLPQLSLADSLDVSLHHHHQHPHQHQHQHHHHHPPATHYPVISSIPPQQPLPHHHHHHHHGHHHDSGRPMYHLPPLPTSQLPPPIAPRGLDFPSSMAVAFPMTANFKATQNTIRNPSASSASASPPAYPSPLSTSSSSSSVSSSSLSPNGTLPSASSTSTSISSSMAIARKSSSSPIPTEASSPPFSSGAGDDKDDKESKRRHTRNLASQEYRRRKRKKLEDLQEEVARLSQKLEDTEKELEQQRNRDINDMMEPMPNFVALIKEGNRIVLFIEAALNEGNDQHLQYLLQLFWSNMELLYIVGEAEASKIFNPFTQTKLWAFGYCPVTNDTPVLRLILDAPWWTEFCIQAGLTSEQIAKTMTLHKTTKITEEALFRDRVMLSQSMRADLFHAKAGPIHVSYEMRPETPSSPRSSPPPPAMMMHHSHSLSAAAASNYSGTSSPSSPPSSDGALSSSSSTATTEAPINPGAFAKQFHDKINMLTNNYIIHIKLVMSVHRQIGALLEPRQHAMLILRGFPSYRSPETAGLMRAAMKVLARAAPGLPHIQSPTTGSSPHNNNNNSGGSGPASMTI